MALVLAFRRFDSPTSFAEFRGIRGRAPWCFDLYSLVYHGSFLSTDGTRMVCRYTAPDAESVRSPSRQHGVPFERIVAMQADGPFCSLAVGDLRQCLNHDQVLLAIEDDEQTEFALAQAVGPSSSVAGTDPDFVPLLTYRGLDGRNALHLYAAPRQGRPDVIDKASELTGYAHSWMAQLHLPAAAY